MEVTTPVAESVPTFDTFEAPFTNPALDLAVRALPPMLTGAYNSGDDIMLVGVDDPTLFVFVAGDPSSPPDPPASVASELQRMLSLEPTAASLGTGTFETSDGLPAGWYGLRYEEDGEIVEEIRLEAPHPNGRGHLVLRARRPGGLGDPQAILGLLGATLDEMLSIS
jgi:hypothetical protein